jgi:diketogulonate reductase-like aldo/keto reductase
MPEQIKNGLADNKTVEDIAKKHKVSVSKIAVRYEEFL